jgi:hypothetical protein
MRLHVVYRSTGSENTKSRPAFYSKLVALKSLLRSAERCGDFVDFVFVNDGPIPDERLALMNGWGDVVQRHGLGAAGSHKEALAQVRDRGWPDSDAVYLVEDDYLHLPEALPDLLEGLEEVQAAEYFALYANHMTARPNLDHFQAGDRVWVTADSTTSTFAARIGALRKDEWVHVNAYHAGGSWDRNTNLACAGVRPYPWPHIAGALAGQIGERRPLEWRLKRAAAQSALALHAIRRAFAPHLLVGTLPAAATHLTLPYLAPDVDWQAVAAETSDWRPSRS